MDASIIPMTNPITANITGMPIKAKNARAVPSFKPTVDRSIISPPKE